MSKDMTRRRFLVTVAGGSSARRRGNRRWRDDRRVSNRRRAQIRFQRDPHPGPWLPATSLVQRVGSLAAVGRWSHVSCGDT